jgi:hypothetical protein
VPPLRSAPPPAIQQQVRQPYALEAHSVSPDLAAQSVAAVIGVAIKALGLLLVLSMIPLVWLGAIVAGFVRANRSGCRRRGLW